MGIRDRHFYPTLFMQIFFLIICLRMLTMFVGIKMSIPYLDPAIHFVFSVAGLIAHTIFGVTGGWYGSP